MGDQTLSQLPETVPATLSPVRRQQLIVEWVQRSGFVTTEQMVQYFEVTPQTIRRDLNELSKQMLITRHHGGAGSIASSTGNTAYAERKVHLYEEYVFGNDLAETGFIRHITTGRFHKQRDTRPVFGQQKQYGLVQIRAVIPAVPLAKSDAIKIFIAHFIVTIITAIDVKPCTIKV